MAEKVWWQECKADVHTMVDEEAEATRPEPEVNTVQRPVLKDLLFHLGIIS